MSKGIFYTDFDYETVLAQDDDGIDPFAATKQDLSDNQDPDHLPPEALSGANFLLEQTIPGWQRAQPPLIAQARIETPLEQRPVGSATTTDTEAIVFQSLKIAGAIVWNPETGEFSQLDLGMARRTNINADHVPVIELGVVDLALATQTFMGAGNNGRRLIAGRPEVSFQDREDN